MAKSVNGILGILSAICFIIVGFSAKNYLSIGEQIAYMITLDIPVLLSKELMGLLTRVMTWQPRLKKKR